MIKIFNYIKLPIFALITLAFIYGGINLAQAKNEISSLKNTKPVTTTVTESPKIEEPKPVEIVKYIPVDNNNEPRENPVSEVTPTSQVTEIITEPTPQETIKKQANKTSSSKTIEEPIPSPTPTIEVKEATVKIENVGTYKIEIKSGDSAFSVLKKAASQNGFNLAYDTYDFGVFVTSIGGIKASNSQFWAFYYNGAFASVGASNQKVNQDDVISWKLQSF